jgi:hypothetical protein
MDRGAGQLRNTLLIAKDRTPRVGQHEALRSRRVFLDPDALVSFRYQLVGPANQVCRGLD